MQVQNFSLHIEKKKMIERACNKYKKILHKLKKKKKKEGNCTPRNTNSTKTPRDSNVSRCGQGQIQAMITFEDVVHDRSKL